MSVVSNNILAGASGQGGAGYAIERSLRFNSGDSAYLNRTPSAAGNRKTWTWSGWVKRTNIGGVYPRMFGNYVGGSYIGWNIEFNNSDKIDIHYYDGSSYVFRRTTTAVYRDPSAWYHIVVAVDTTQSTANDRLKLYVNGVQVTTFDTTTNVSQNYDTNINTAIEHRIGYNYSYSDFYLTDVHFIDGQALAPTDFGKTNTNNLWVPKKFAGTYEWFDQSQTWSGQITGSNYSGYPKTQAFNNDTTNYCLAGAGSELVFTPSPSFSSATTVKIWYYMPTTDANAIKINGTGVGNDVATTGAVATHTFTVSGFTSLSWSRGYYGSEDVGIARIDVDGIQLVDSGVSIGNNSFHLDFADNSSNAALGTDTSGNSNTWTVNNLSAGISNAGPYVSQFVSSTGFNASYPAINAFDNSTSTYAQASTSGGTLTFTPSTGISYTSSIKIWMPSAGATASINGGSSVSVANSSEATIATGSGTLTSLVLAASNLPGLAYIKIDDQILTDSGLDTGNDSLVDTPTNGDTASDTGAGGEITGNYATLNPLLVRDGNITYSQGNLEITSSSYYRSACSTINLDGGKWYIEATCTTISDNLYNFVGVVTRPEVLSYPGSNSGDDGFCYYSGNGAVSVNTVTQATYSTWTTGDVIGLAYDSATRKCWVSKNGTWQNSGDPANGTGSVHTVSGTKDVFYAVAAGTNGVMTANFGSRPFAYAAPTGFKSLNTANLSSTIADGSLYFDTKLFTGNGGTQSITGYNFSPDFAWIKNRSAAASNNLADAVRGVNKVLFSDNTGTENTDTNRLTAFNSDGFDVGSNNAVNGNGNGIVAWAWDAGDSNTTIAAGGLNSSLYNQSQTWSNGKDGDRSDYPVTNVFDASLTTVGYGSVNQTITVTLPGGSIALTSLRVRADRAGTATGKFYVNGNDYTSQIASGTNWNTITGETSITSIGYASDTGSNFVGLYAVEVNGKQLVDSGVSVPNFPSIASTVRANPSAGFSIVKYTAAGTASTIGHNLNAAPELIFVKRTDANASWSVYHASTGNTKVFELNGTGAASTSSTSWNSTTPTSSVFSIGNYPDTGDNGGTYIAYCFAPVEGHSSVGSFLGNGSTDGPFVYTGFKVAWLLTRSTSSSRSWNIWDTARDTHNPMDANLFPNNSNAEGSDPLHNIDMLSNGFKPRTGNVDRNGSGETYIYLAFASNPFASNGGLAR